MYVDVCRHPGTLLLSCVLNCLYCIVQHVIYVFVFTSSILFHFSMFSLWYKIVYCICANHTLKKIDITYNDVNKFSIVYFL